MTISKLRRDYPESSVAIQGRKGRRRIRASSAGSQLAILLRLAARRPFSRTANASLAPLLHFCEPYPAATDRWKLVWYEYGAMAQSWRSGFRD